MNNSLKWMSALYGLLIRLYPRAFRQAFGDELHSVFIALAQDAVSVGPWALLVFCLRELRDFPINLFRTHLEKNPMSQIFNADSGRFMLRGVLAFVVLLVTYNVAFYVLMNSRGLFFLPAAFFLDYDQVRSSSLVILATLSTSVIASAIAGTSFSAVLGQRPRIHWIVALAVVTLLPWFVPFVVSALLPQISLNRSSAALGPDLIWIIIASVLLLVLSFGILIVMLLREPPHFRWFTLTAMLVWLLPVLNSQDFPIMSILGISSMPMQIQRILSNLMFGACMAGVLGILLQNPRKMFWLMIAGGLLYVLVDYVFYLQIYDWLMPTLFPMIDFATFENVTNEQFAMLEGVRAASLGLMFGLSLAFVFIWLQRGKLPAALQPVAQT